jgi:hypothetical protein
LYLGLGENLGVPYICVLLKFYETVF